MASNKGFPSPFSQPHKKEAAFPPIVSPPELDYKEQQYEEQVAPPTIVGHPWKLKGPALLAVLFMTLGSNFASSSISPLKSTIKQELAITNVQYSVIDTADSLINTILPVITGVAVDYYGPLAGSIYASSVILLGSVLCGIATSVKSYPLLVVGQIVMGFGSTTIETVQSKLYSFYCLGGGIMGFVYGLDIGIGRVYNLMGKLTAVPIMDGTGSWTWSFWVPAIMCGFSWGLNMAFFLYERTFPSASRVPTGRQAALKTRCAKSGSLRTAGRDVKRKLGFSIKEEKKYFVYSIAAIPACFWIIVISQLFQAGAVNSYTSNLADAIAVTRHATKEAAGYTSALGQVIPIVLTPCLGYFFDRFGRRMHWVAFTAALWVLVFSLLAYTTVNPLVPSILGSLALATNVLPWIASIPLLVPNQANLGTAFGIYKALNSCGTVVINISSGAIQDRATPGPLEYDAVFYLLIVLKGLDVVYGLGYHWFDILCLGGILHASEKKRVEIELETTESERIVGLRKPINKLTLASLGIVVAMIITAWVLFLYYSV